MKNYNSRHRPVKKESTTVQVNVFLSISHVEKVDEHEQTMLVHGHLWATWFDEYLVWEPNDYNGTSKINIDPWRIWQPALALYNSEIDVLSIQDEHEQTMLVHGHLWATWFDEYLVWEPNDYNGTSKINIDPWRIWQPALALYNSARGNSWHLYMHGLPAIIGNTGRVWATGSFSFHVTCRFDFSDWPYDEQQCPIVVADWVYDLSRVNLSDPQGNTPWNKPTIRLNYDPIRQDEKKHVAGYRSTGFPKLPPLQNPEEYVSKAKDGWVSCPHRRYLQSGRRDSNGTFSGWEVMDTWRRHCYWGPNGCKDELPEGQVLFSFSFLVTFA
ncbi:hypothetical protein DICVIV_07157 [Dictyocaulus viviparus]|uniref:Neurotransmitter-gated ion-channel ligand-binding domain-containing protein n=1 Tax=Dictyocaulus viviparus TaxID=29172 RepID=A0A0D8XSL7_DICVI|nr:hypothetical protein DICVIV_07157 [Dictyocaulus viviparus]